MFRRWSVNLWRRLRVLWSSEWWASLGWSAAWTALSTASGSPARSSHGCSCYFSYWWTGALIHLANNATLQLRDRFDLNARFRSTSAVLAALGIAFLPLNTLLAAPCSAHSAFTWLLPRSRVLHVIARLKLIVRPIRFYHTIVMRCRPLPKDAHDLIRNQNRLSFSRRALILHENHRNDIAPVRCYMLHWRFVKHREVW